MKYLTIIQARCSSSRLPGKSLMPVGGVPLALLCALRAKNKFSKAIVVTSTEDSDNKLANILMSAGINVYRGSLNNVLSRFIDVIDSYKLKDNDTVIRLTADNPIVDGAFLEIMRQAWEEMALDYLCAEPEDKKKSNWPKGLNAEFIKVRLLKDSYEVDKSSYNLEHVTPFVRENTANKAFGDEATKLQFKEKYFLGIDVMVDYLRVSAIFDKSNIKAPFDTILKTIEV